MSKNYRKMYKPPEEVETEQVVEPVTRKGVVDCIDKLRVRQNPSLDADVVCLIKDGTELTVYESGSTKDFYKVRTAEGQKGYCLKTFVHVEW